MHQLGYFPSHLHFLSLVMRGGGACPRASILLLMYWQRQTPLGPACTKHIYGPFSFPPFHWAIIHQASSHWPGTELQGCMLRARHHLVISQRMTYNMWHLEQMIIERAWVNHLDSSFEIQKQNNEFLKRFEKLFLGISNMMVFVTFLVHPLCVRQTSFS